MSPNSLSCCQLKNIKLHLDNYSKIFIRVLPIYWAFLTFMLLRPSVKVDPIFLFQGVDKVVHFGIFTVLSFCFMSALPRLRFSVSLLILLVYALLTEVFQGIMKNGRTFELLDIVADTAGILTGIFIYRQMKKRN